MAQITITIPDELVPDCAKYKGYQNKIEGDDGSLINNPETELQFVNRYSVNYWRNAARRQQADTAASAACKPIMAKTYDDIY